MDIKKIILIVIALLILLGIAYASPVRNVCTNSRCYCHYDRCNCSMERRICRKPVNYYDYGYYNRISNISIGEKKDLQNKVGKDE